MSKALADEAKLKGKRKHAAEETTLKKLETGFSLVHFLRVRCADSVSRKTVKTLALILVWYVFSTGLSLYNKQLVGKEHGLFGKGAFPAPLFMSSIQFACQTLLAKITFATGIAERTNSRRMAWSDYFRLVVPNGIITGLDIGFSNKSLVFINLSFYTMCKSTVPVFLLFFAFVWGIEKPSLELMGVVCVIVAGLTLLVWGETKFDMLGFGLVMTASCLSGLRFTLTQVLLHGHHSSSAMGGPLEVLELLTPVMSVTVLLFSLAWEELWASLPSSPYFAGLGHSALTLLIIWVGAIFAFLMVWAEYQVIKETSALTFMIAGTVKEVVTVLAAVAIMGDKLTPVNGVGLGIVICGVLLFNYHKYKKLKQGEIPVYNALAPNKDDEDAPLMNGHHGSSANGGGGGSGPSSPQRSAHGGASVELAPLLAATGSGQFVGQLGGAGAAPMTGSTGGAGGVVDADGKGDAVVAVSLSGGGLSGRTGVVRTVSHHGSGGTGSGQEGDALLVPLQAGLLSTHRS